MIKEQEKNDKARRTQIIKEHQQLPQYLPFVAEHTHYAPGTAASTVPTVSQCPHSNPLREALTQPQLKEKPVSTREGKQLAQGHTAR